MTTNREFEEIIKDIPNTKPSSVSEHVLVRIDNFGEPDGFIIICNFFKPSGKWYMREDIVIPLDTRSYNFHEAIKINARVKGYFITCENLIGVPILVDNTERDISDKIIPGDV